MTYTILQVSKLVKYIVTISIVATISIILQSCQIYESDMAESMESFEEKNSDASETVEVSNPSVDHKIPSDALVCYSLTSYDFGVLLRDGLSIEILNDASEIIIYFLPSQIGGYITSTLLPENITYDRDNVRIGEYNIGIEYYNILSDKNIVSQILSTNIAESDIKYVTIIQYEYNKPVDEGILIVPGWHPSAVFWVHTLQGDYFLKDDYDYDENSSIIHNWVVYTLEEYPW
jgi:hypothetical protein